MSMIAELSSVCSSSELQEKHRFLLRTRPGILVFSYMKQLQYVNRRACELIRHISNASEGSGLVLPSLWCDLRDEIQAGLDDRLGAQVQEPFEINRVVSEGGHRLLLRGYGQPDTVSGASARIIILVDEIARTEQDGTRHAQ